MRLASTLGVLNRMRDAGVIGEYAIGGAVAAFLYVEPGTTFDLEIFILWEQGEGGLIQLGPIYAYLSRLGYTPRREGVMLEGWEVQFLPAKTPLEKEALAEAILVEIGGVAAHAFTAEYLMAICLQTGRPKDLARLVQFSQEGQPDLGLLSEILERHGLTQKWTSFKDRFPA